MCSASTCQSLRLQPRPQARAPAQRHRACLAPRVHPRLVDCPEVKSRVSLSVALLVRHWLLLRCLSYGQDIRGRFKEIRWWLFAWETGVTSRRLATRSLVRPESSHAFLVDFEITASKAPVNIHSPMCLMFYMNEQFQGLAMQAYRFLLLLDISTASSTIQGSTSHAEVRTLLE